MTEELKLEQIDEQIREVRENLRYLMEQATARSGAQDENRGDDLIASPEEKLARLLKDRETLIG